MKGDKTRDIPLPAEGKTLLARIRSLALAHHEHDDVGTAAQLTLQGCAPLTR